MGEHSSQRVSEKREPVQSFAQIAVIDVGPNGMSAEVLDEGVPFEVALQFLLTVDTALGARDASVRNTEMRSQIELQPLAADLSDMAVS